MLGVKTAFFLCSYKIHIKNAKIAMFTPNFLDIFVCF